MFRYYIVFLFIVFSLCCNQEHTRKCIHLMTGSTSCHLCNMWNICKAFEELRNELIYNTGHLVLCQGIESRVMAHDFVVCINTPQVLRAEMGESISGQNVVHDIGN